YGDRLGSGGQKGMKSFYFKLGESLRATPGWRLYVLSGNPAFESAFHARPRQKRELWNGPIPCTLLGYPPPPLHEGSEAPLGVPQQAPDVAPVRPEDEGEEQG
ncbi:MAG TPA: RNA methyltransferase, partial [Myxococcaceae bacterium]|nr:RNA methyltransferase [Myxococcaceae bacterium]